MTPKQQKRTFLFIYTKIEIADKLLKEEKQMKKRYQQQPQLWPEKRDRNKVTFVRKQNYDYVSWLSRKKL